jgi:hypothetical protein
MCSSGCGKSGDRNDGTVCASCCDAFLHNVKIKGERICPNYQKPQQQQGHRHRTMRETHQSFLFPFPSCPFCRLFRECKGQLRRKRASARPGSELEEPPAGSGTRWFRLASFTGDVHVRFMIQSDTNPQRQEWRRRLRDAFEHNVGSKLDFCTDSMKGYTNSPPC